MNYKITTKNIKPKINEYTRNLVMRVRSVSWLRCEISNLENRRLVKHSVAWPTVFSTH